MNATESQETSVREARASSREDRAVSPVIGVVLMVAITVVLAASIGTFVLDLGSRTGQTAPTVTMQVSDGADDFEQTPGTNYEFIVIEHNGGDRLAAADTRVMLRHSDGTVLADWNQGVSSSNGTDGASEVYLQRNGNNVTEGNYRDAEFSTGDRLAIVVDPATGSGFEDDADYEVQVLDTGSERIVAQSTVRVR